MYHICLKAPEATLPVGNNSCGRCRGLRDVDDDRNGCCPTTYVHRLHGQVKILVGTVARGL